MPNTEKENLYKIDTSGQVWTINVGGKGGGGAPPTWSLLPNPTKLDLKRISSRSDNVLWGVSSDHQIYVYVCKLDIPIRVKEETYENQRWFPVDGFSYRLLPTDRPHFSTEDGITERTKDSVLLPSDCWEWEADWQIETLFEGQVLDAKGWTYAVDFPASYHAEKSWKSCVRRRKWFRTRRFIGFNRWQKINPIYEDFTQEPFTDICASTFGVSHDVSCVWAVTVLGQVYFRTDVSPTNPEGTAWQLVPIKKGMEACQITLTSTGIPLVVAWTGSLVYRTGLTPHNLIGTDWIEANGPRNNGLLQISAGTSALWGITRDRKCWALKGDLQECISKHLTTFDWNEIPRKLKSISVSKSDQVVLGVGEEDGEIYVRFGIDRDQQHGQGWRKAFPEAERWDAASTNSASSSEVGSLDQTDAGSGSSGESMISIRPSLPKCADIEDQSRKTVCWVDGGCLSMLRFTTTETDLEVGPWREDILQSLQTVQSNRVQFQYPEAVDKSEFVSWSKSTTAFMLQHGCDTMFIKGQLEILNNDTIVFHKNLNHRWVCAMQDVLSVLATRELTFTLRIRNSIEVGVSDFISFRFSNEKELEDWYNVVNELSQKNPEDMTLVNCWMTSTQGEVLECGFAKISDSPLEGEIITPTNTENRTHHPLIKGFLPGSSIRLDISIPLNAQSFSMNLEGRTYTAFHFNPRFETACVVRNTMSHGEWGEEERDGVFPFISGHSYIVTIECTDTHIITTVSVQRKQFIFTYRHRVAPKYITSFNAGGDVNILGIRYDPKSGHDSSQPEFTTKPVPGHFWKVEAARPGFVWAISFDYNVWVYTLSSKDHKKFESDSFNTVTDDEVVYIYENQRWNPLTGFGSIGLPTDRSPWSDETGRIPMDKETVRLRSYKWKWISDWEIDYSVKNGVDEDGWQYAIDFPASYHSSKRFNDFVRRRRWKRVSRYAVDGPWQLVPGVQLVDLTITMNEDCEWELLGATKNGDAVVRCGISLKNPAGTHWDQISGEKSFISISSWFGQKYWAIGKDGYAYIRYTNNWQMLDKPEDSRLKFIRVGPNGDVWAVGTNYTLYRRTNIVHPALPEGKDWCEACKGVLNISFGADGTLYALLKKKGGVYSCSLAKRVGVLQDSPNGLGWDMIAEGPWSHLSMCGVKTRSA